MARKPPGKSDQPSRSARVGNRRALFDYHILEKVECGMELLGTEVKSLRAGNASLEGAYARFNGHELFLLGCNIAIYPQAQGALQHDPLRDRRLLLHRRQLSQLRVHVEQKGHTLVPLALYFKGGWAKCELGSAVGKRAYDKRRSLQQRQQERDIARAMHRRRGEP